MFVTVIETMAGSGSMVGGMFSDFIAYFFDAYSGAFADLRKIIDQGTIIEISKFIHRVLSNFSTRPEASGSVHRHLSLFCGRFVRKSNEHIQVLKTWIIFRL